MAKDATDVAIRVMVSADLPRLKAAIDATGLFPAAMLDDMAAPFLSGGSTTESWFVADRGGAIGLVYVADERMTSGTCNMLLIAVDPAEQSRGVGSRLVRHVEDHLARQGKRILLVETSGLPEFEPTRMFYLGNGYGIEARIRDFYQAGEDKIVFRKELPPSG